MESLPVMVATTARGVQSISRRGINLPAHPMAKQLINKRNLVILELPKLPRFRQNPVQVQKAYYFTISLYPFEC
ncbi:hypothetical protein IC575_029549 [Cucumis melo]